MVQSVSLTVVGRYDLNPHAVSAQQDLLYLRDLAYVAAKVARPDSALMRPSTTTLSFAHIKRQICAGIQKPVDVMAIRILGHALKILQSFIVIN